MDTSIVNTALNVAEAVAPTSEAVQVAQDIEKTVANPSDPATIISDLTLALSLAKQVKFQLEGMHPSVSAIFKQLF